MNSALPGPRIPVVDANGLINAEWYRYFVGLEKNASNAVAGEVEAGAGLIGGGIVASGVTLAIGTGGVTRPMLANGLATSVVGRFQGSNGPVADIQATADNRLFGRFGGILAFKDIDLIAAVVGDGDYGDIVVSGVGTVYTIDTNVVSNAKFRQSAGLSVVGRSAATTGNVADIAGTASQFLGINAAGTTLAFQTLAGDATLSGPTITLSTVNANTGAWGSATQAPVITLDAKGRATAASNVTITPAASSVTGGAALTKTDDTNVTLTLGGTPTAALLAATSLTLGWTGTLGVARGGTNIASYAIGDILYASGATTLSKLADVATGNVLISGGVTTAPSWGKVGLTTHVSGTLPIANGGTNQTSLGDITRTNDTNVTLTLGGTPTGAVITSTSFTLGWSGQLAVTRGGSGLSSSVLGDIWYGSAANTMAALAGNTTSTKKWLNQTGTGTVSAAPTWTTIAASDIVSGAALTKTDDTNVTLTLGGSPTSALLAAASLTLGWTGTLGVTRGGTGLGSATQGDIIYASAANTYSALAKNTTASRYLSNGGTSNNPAWAQIDLSNGVTGTLPAANGGTGDTGSAWSAWTPTITANSGTFTSVSASGRYKQIGKTVFFSAIIDITTNGTAASWIIMTMPFASASVSAGRFQPFTGKEMNTALMAVSGAIYNNSSNALITKYDGTYPGSSGYSICVEGAYEAA